MTASVGILILGLALVNFRFSGKVPAYAPTVLCLVWGGVLVLLGSLSSRFYQPSAEALLTFLLGVAAFSIGASQALPRRAPRFSDQLSAHLEKVNPWISRRADRVCWFLLVTSALLLPGFFEVSSGGVTNIGASSMFQTIRRTSIITGEDQLESSIDFWENAPILAFGSLILSALLFRRGRIWEFRLAASFGLTALFGIANASNAAVVRTILVASAILLIRRRKVPIGLTIAVGSLLVGFFFIIAWLVGKGGARPDQGFWENIGPVFDTLIVYLVGPIAAYGQIAENPTALGNPHNPARFFLLLISKLGGAAPSSVHAEFTSIGSGFWQNAYTVYFGWVATLGLLAVPVLMFFFGWLAATALRRAREGSAIAALVTGYCFSAVVLSAFNDGFFLSMDYFIKMGMVVLLATYRPRSLRQGSAASSSPRWETARG